MKANWDYYRAKWFLGAVRRRIAHTYFKKYAGRDFLTAEAGNDLIYEAIMRGDPFVAGRFGSTELSIMANREARENKRHMKCDDHRICELSGFFPENKELIDQFCMEMKRIIPELDLLASWYLPMEEFFVDRYMPEVKLSKLTCVEPYAFQKPWSTALQGKKVLVIHPFAESIEKQYGKREMIYPGTEILPQFELKVIKAVQTIAGEKDGRFENWFQALDYMKEQMYMTDFDVAVIGCGAYGMPLAVEAKRMGKIAVHMGGATQLLFGIIGNRWMDNHTIMKFYNENWTRPDSAEVPERSKVVEDACYW